MALIRVLSTMTGTSCDALDVVLLKISKGTITVEQSDSYAYPAGLAHQILALQQPKSTHLLEEILTIDREYSRFVGRSLCRFINRTRAKADLVSFHGQTIAHFPPPFGVGTTWQMGDPSIVAQMTRITVASHFRQGDLAAGGQGAPLVPLFYEHVSKTLWQKPDLNGRIFCFHNIGGISNLSVHQARKKTIAFDTGPGNLWIDAATKSYSKGKLRFDRAGSLAKKGTCDNVTLASLFKHPFLFQPVPKSTGRDEFPFELFEALRGKNSKKRNSDEQLNSIRTALEFTVETIAHAYENTLRLKLAASQQQKPIIFLSGGGASNDFLVTRLRERLGYLLEFRKLDDLGLPSQYVEAIAFGWIAYQSLNGNSVGGPWTGAPATSANSTGWLTPGKNWKSLISIWLKP